MCSFGNIAIGVGTIICVVFLFVLSEYFRKNKRRFIGRPIIRSGIVDTNPLVYYGENESRTDSSNDWRYYEEIEKAKNSETSFTIEDREGSEEEFVFRKKAPVSSGHPCQMGSEEIPEVVSNG
jgi:hypothetical protein